jgi:hypothetical protein
MAFEAAVRERLERSFAMYRDLLNELGEGALTSRLGDLRSNTIGARRWSGFNCSLDDTTDAARVGEALASSENAVRVALDGMHAADDAPWGLVLDLLEHEAAHHGQLIRYLYGLDLQIPDSWKRKYALD